MAKTAKHVAPTELSLGLYAPGMGPLHQAGLGGLAASLRSIERRIKQLNAADVPGNWDGSSAPPWSISADNITLRWQQPELAGEYLRTLFANSFRIREGMIDLPGTYRMEPGTLVTNELQLGLTLTFLQFGAHRKLSDTETRFIDPYGDGQVQLQMDYRRCFEFLHQSFVENLVTKQGTLIEKPIEQPSAFCPGAVVRHVGYGTATRIEMPVGHVLAAAFSLVGCLSLPINAGTGILLIPEIEDLSRFADVRPRLTPTSIESCRVAAPSDAALQAAVRVRAHRIAGIATHGVRGIHAMTLRPTPWNKKQKQRVDAVFVPTQRVEADSDSLRKFAIVMRMLPRKVRSKVTVEVNGRGKSAPRMESVETFLVDNPVRPLIADNLAFGRLWYAGFAALCGRTEHDGRKTVEKVKYESNGLLELLENETMTSESERLIIRALHRAMYQQMGKIYNETMGKDAARRHEPPSKAVKNRWANFQQKTRLSLLNAKTASQTHAAIIGFIGSSGFVRELQRDEASLVAFLEIALGADWQRARNLSLLAIVSYRKPENLSANDAVPGIDEFNELSNTASIGA